jgi:putative cardiolipin synthase
MAYVRSISESRSISAIYGHRLRFEWAVTRMLSDDPAKGLGRAAPEGMFPQQLSEIIGDPARHLELVAAYFVPRTTGVDSFIAMAKRGVKIRVLTNSLEALDGPYVYAGYAKRRKSLLEAGLTLYEMKRLSPDTESKNAGPFGSSGSSLHAKTFSVDSSRIFVGSFNFDPRSRNLNTELGFVIDSPVLAQQIEAAFKTSIPANAYEVHLSDAGKVYWIEHRDGELIRYDKSPGTSWWLRAAVWLLSLLPIDWLL